MMIKATDISVSFGRYTAIRGVTFTVNEGEFLAILGPNGAGKSTLIRCLMGTVTPDSGEIRLRGQPPTDVSSELYGYIPQIKSVDRLFPALPTDLVMSGFLGRWPWFPTGKHKERAVDALRKAGLEAKINTPIAQLSGGELQRVYLARAFAKTPRLLILDEPVTGLDAVGEWDLYRLLDAYRQETGATVVMITHDWEVARHHAQKVLLLNRRQVAFGAPAVAMTDDLLRQTFGHQGHAHPMDLHLGEDHRQ